ncbi:MAG: hypothetical protein JNM09_17565 [Blastocatellia bacterium]|nr:hypothetical protein [Blastocatellia bacterium]
MPSTLPLGTTPPAIEMPSTPPPPMTATAPQATASTEAINIPSAYLPQAAQTYNAPPPMPAMPMGTSKKSSGTLKVVLISLALIMILGIVSVIGAVYFVGKRASQTIAEIKKNGLPTVTNNAESVPDEKLGVPIYPGAKRENTVSGSFGSMSGAVVTFSTKDNVEEVAAFYREHFKENQNQHLNEISNSADADGENSVVFQVNGEGGSRLVTISPQNKNSNRTEIVVIIGNGVPGMTGFPGPPPPPPPPPRNAAERKAQEAERKAQEIERRALEQADKVLRDLENAPVPPTKR